MGKGGWERGMGTGMGGMGKGKGGEGWRSEVRVEPAACRQGRTLAGKDGRSPGINMRRPRGPALAEWVRAGRECLLRPRGPVPARAGPLAA